jgi:putative RecB family exonuclease
LTNFWEIHSADFHLPVALENRFLVDIKGIKLMGFIDRVDKLESGGLSIIDYKSNKELFTADYLQNDLQLTIYKLAAEQTWQLPVEKLTLYHLRSNTPCSCAPRDPVRLDDARRLILEVADNITSEKFPATENQYCPCDFPEHCPYFRHLYMESPAARQDLLPGIAAAEAVETYASLKAQINELETRLEEARQVISDFCQVEGLNRIYGDEHEITYKLIERTGFDEDEVRVLLEPEGLWEKVLGLDQSRVRKLLTDKEISGSIKEKLESLKRVTGTHSQLQIKKRAGDEE